MNIEHLITAYLKASRQVKLNTAIRTFYTILRFIVLATLLLAFEFGKEAIFYGNIAAAGATIILGGYWGGVKQRRIGREDLAKIKEYLGYGIPLHLDPWSALDPDNFRPLHAGVYEGKQ